MFKATSILSSVGPAGVPLHTVELTYPRCIHSEVMTHRDRARNSASSRAIPWKRMRDNVTSDPFVPLSFDSEQKGMQSGDAVPDQAECTRVWMQARDAALMYADRLHAAGVHKSICNRLTEPFMWITVVMTATDWNNFFRLRCHPDAEKHMQRIAYMCRDVVRGAHVQVLRDGEWHLPYLRDDEAEVARHAPLRWARVSVARCARVSYLTHDGVRDVEQDLQLFKKLTERPDEVVHASPLEHAARAVTDPAFRSGPFRGWEQFRKLFPGESVCG